MADGLRGVLDRVAQGALTVEDALRALGEHAEKNLGFARVDTDRLARRGFPEVIYCPGKTAQQVAAIAGALWDRGQSVLGTRATREQYEAVSAVLPAARYSEAARCIVADAGDSEGEGQGCVAVVSAGTVDLPVAEEAALVAECLGARVVRVYDVGVAGLHRLLAHVDGLRDANAVVVAAGMEGALPSVVGGLIDRPIIAVPVSAGYGTSFGGVTALLAMLNSCVPGITVVNIDNGFGAGVAAAMINRLACGEAGARGSGERTRKEGQA